MALVVRSRILEEKKDIVEKPDSSADKIKKAKKKRTAVSFMIEFFVKIGLTALVVWLLCFFVVGVYVNHNNSSYPMIKDGDLCLTYKLGALREGEAIAYINNGKVFFGRIVGMPGDIVDISENTITVNGYGVYENTVYPTTAEGATISFPYVVPSDSYFILNDYRDDINDSRVFGAVKKDDTKGKIVLLLRRRGI